MQRLWTLLARRVQLGISQSAQVMEPAGFDHDVRQLSPSAAPGLRVLLIWCWELSFLTEKASLPRQESSVSALVIQVDPEPNHLRAGRAGRLPASPQLYGRTLIAEPDLLVVVSPSELATAVEFDVPWLRRGYRQPENRDQFPAVSSLPLPRMLRIPHSTRSGGTNVGHSSAHSQVSRQ